MNKKGNSAGLEVRPIVVVTGASGAIGRHLVEELTSSGFRVRAVTSKPLGEEQTIGADVEWRSHDFMSGQPVDHLVEGCVAVLHLAATLWDMSKMPRLNTEATRLLAEAASRQGLRFFGYTSSVTVYGSAKTAYVDESTPLITGDQDVKSEYRGNPSKRAYARSKVLAEKALAEVAGNLECVIFRPTLVVDFPTMVGVIRRKGAKHVLLGKRHEHHIYVGDVAHAMVWFLRRALDRSEPAPGLEVFNLADDEGPTVTSAAMAAGAGLRRGPAAPAWAYDLVDMLLSRRLTRRKGMGIMRYSAKKLRATGYRFKHGLEEAQRLAIASTMTSSEP